MEHEVVESCGAELASGAVVIERLAALMAHVAENLGAHARWVGAATPAAARESAALIQLAGEYRAIHSAASRAAATMSGLRDLAPAPHDPAHWDKRAFLAWLRTKIDLQRSLAELLLTHAAAAERSLTP